MIRIVLCGVLSVFAKSCSSPAALPQQSTSLPAGCRYVTSADLAFIQIYDERSEIEEQQIGKRSVVKNDPSLGAEDNRIYHTTSLRFMHENGMPTDGCYAIPWRVVPSGKHPADGRSFYGGKFPNGVAILPARSGEAYATTSLIDDHRSSPDKTFRTEILDASGKVIWGNVEKPRDAWGGPQINPTSVVATVHDTERQCSSPDPADGYKVQVQRREDGYWLIIGRKMKIDQCAIVAWRYVSDDIPSDHPDDEMYLQGAAFFSPGTYADGMEANQSFRIFEDNGLFPGRHVTILVGVTSETPRRMQFALPSEMRDVWGSVIRHPAQKQKTR